MLRTFITPDHQDISIQLPESFIGKEIEVIAFPVDEAQASAAADDILTHFASEQVLVRDWMTKEEDAAWQSL